MVDVSIEGSRGRIRIPQPVAPQLNDGGSDEWYDLRNLSIDSSGISGRVKFNFMGGSDVRIDRRSGVLTIGGSFRADCTAVDTSKPKF